MRTTVPLAAVAAATALALSLSACSADTSAGGAEMRLVIFNPEPSQGLDPAAAFADASRIPMAMIYETLIERDETGAFVGSLASDWTVSEDALRYEFSLRDDSAFSDGSPITAADVVFSLERAKAGAVLAGALADATFEAVDDANVVVALTVPSSGLLTALATPGSAGILSQAAVEEAGESYFTSPTVTSGPWSLHEYIPKSNATFVANTEYYNVPEIDVIEYTFSEDQSSHAAAMRSGTADIAGVGYADAEQLKLEADNGIAIVETDTLAPLFWGWDQTQAPFSDVRVRQAVAWAVDRVGRQDACWYGTGAVTYGNILRPWDAAYEEINTYQASSRDESLANAAALLDEAGWVESSDGARVSSGVEGLADGAVLEFNVPYEGNWPAAECHVQVLQQNLADVGISVTPESYDAAAYWGDVATNAFTMYHGGAGAIDAADLYINWFASTGSLTALTTHLQDPEIDSMVQEGRTTTDPARAIEIWKELEQWQAENLPMLVVGYQWPQTAISDRVTGYGAQNSDSRWLIDAVVAG